GRLAEARLDARGGQPGTPVGAVAPDRALDRPAGGDEVAGALLDEGKLEVRRPRPGLEPRGRDGVSTGRAEPAGPGSGLAPADLDACKERNRLREHDRSRGSGGGDPRQPTVRPRAGRR